MVTKTGIVKDRRYLDHWMGEYHPECPERLQIIYAMLEDPDMAKRFREVPVRRAEKDELLLIHALSYVDLLESTAGREYTYLDPDTHTCAASYETALLAVGGLCQAVAMVHSGELKNAFALVRPPGHHAEKGHAKGFCLFNNVGVGARYAQEYLGIRRVLIADWDLHHGNGTQHAFENDPSILYFSTHQYPYYPGSGAFEEAGSGRGKGYTVNVPITVGYGDGEFIGLYEKILRPIALEFNPELILVSAGFDTYAGDPLGGMNVTPEGFAGLTRTIMNIADECCGGKMVCTLEGGYHLEGQRDSVKYVLNEMAGLTKTNPLDLMGNAEQRILDYVLERVRAVHHRYWKNL